MIKYVKFLFAIIGLFIASVPNVQAQHSDLGAISDKLNRLERDIQSLSRSFYKGKQLPNVSGQKSPKEDPLPNVGNAYIIRLEDRLAEMKAELQTSTSRMESVSHALEGIKSRVDKLVSDIDFRLTRLENFTKRNTTGPSRAKSGALSPVPRVAGVEQVGASTGGPIVSSDKPGILGKISEENLSAISVQANKSDKIERSPKAFVPNKEAQKQFILPKGAPEIQYQFALSILRKTEYDRAEHAFVEFIQRNPTNKLTPNARYWLGESFYVRKNYRSAAEAFLRGYQQAPEGLKAPSSLLKLGMSLANLKKNQDACATFSKLAKDYPDASENIKKHLSREFKRSSCD